MPFLLSRDVQDLFTRVFLSEHGQHTRSQHDLFCTFMILAIGSVIPYRKGSYDSHPFGYYLAAMKHFDPYFIASGLSAIQDLLLISRFGVYHHIGILLDRIHISSIIS